MGAGRHPLIADAAHALALTLCGEFLDPDEATRFAPLMARAVAEAATEALIEIHGAIDAEAQLHPDEDDGRTYSDPRDAMNDRLDRD